MRSAAVFSAIVGGAMCSASLAEDPQKLETSPVAQAFGAPPAMWRLGLSPDGTKIVFVQSVPEGPTIARVLDMSTKKATVVLAGKPREFDVSWCDWATNSRLLCGVRGIVELYGGHRLVAATRLIAVNADGSKIKVVLERKADEYTQFQDRIVDWLPDDPDNVLVQLPSPTGSGVARLNVETGELKTETRIREGVYSWISDGYGAPRLYEMVTSSLRRWFVRETPDASWQILRETELDDLEDEFSPVGFGESRSELLYYGSNEGRTALFALDLEHHRTRLVYAHPTFDVDDVIALGKHHRLVAAAYSDDRPHLHFFDARIEKLQQTLDKYFAGKLVSVIDEDWSQRYYLVFVASDTDAGSYYRFDFEKLLLELIVHAYPALGDRKLAPMRAIRYPAADGVQVPAYLTLPVDRSAGPLPAVVLPHGGPSARDYWSYDFLVQYLVASGYAVLQSNYRGSDGYGREWLGKGGYRDWRRAISDITAGADYLVREGIADPRRLCVVGWSYGGYAALMSAIEEPTRYRCVASVAGVTDPGALSTNALRFVGGSRAFAFIGADDDEVRNAGSPNARADAIRVPIFLAHARQDLNVPFEQSANLTKTLRRAHKDVEFVEYEDAEHDISPERYRVDLLTRLGAFLQRNLAD